MNWKTLSVSIDNAAIFFLFLKRNQFLSTAFVRNSKIARHRLIEVICVCDFETLSMCRTAIKSMKSEISMRKTNKKANQRIHHAHVEPKCCELKWKRENCCWLIARFETHFPVNKIRIKMANKSNRLRHSKIEWSTLVNKKAGKTFQLLFSLFRLKCDNFDFVDLF